MVDRPFDEHAIEKFHARLGEAISDWQWVEINLCSIFLDQIKSQNPHAAATAFNSVINFNAKLAMVDAVLYNTISHLPIFSTWNGKGGIKTALQKASKKRNQMAHMMFIHKSDLEESPHLTHSIYELNRPMQQYLKPIYKIKDIEAAIEEFRTIQQRLLGFLGEISNKEPPG